MKTVRHAKVTFAVFPDHEALSRSAARIVVDLIRMADAPLICLASGSTPRRTYDLIPPLCRGDGVTTDRVRFVKLDEWLDLPTRVPGTCEAQLTEQLIDPLGVDAGRYLSFASDPVDPVAECARVATALEAQGPIDLAILGLGRNGHLGFNEPAKALIPNCHVTTLSAVSQDHPMVRDTNAVPTRGITLGIADILHARRVLLLASGAEKREQVVRMVSGTVDPRFPASFLQLHPAVTCVCDEDAAALLPGAS